MCVSRCARRAYNEVMRQARPARAAENVANSLSGQPAVDNDSGLADLDSSLSGAPRFAPAGPQCRSLCPMERAMHALHLNGSVPALAGRRSNFKAGSCTAVAPRPHAGGANTGRQSSFVVRCMADAQAEGEASSSAAVPKKKGFGKASSATVAPDKLCPCGEWAPTK